jgi:hypothetical protein
MREAGAGNLRNDIYLSAMRVFIFQSEICVVVNNKDYREKARPFPISTIFRFNANTSEEGSIACCRVRLLFFHYD